MSSEKFLTKANRITTKFAHPKFKVELPKFISEMELEDIIGQPPGSRTDIKQPYSTGRSSSLAEIKRKSKTPSPAGSQNKMRAFFKRRDIPKSPDSSITARKDSIDPTIVHQMKDLTLKWQQEKSKTEEMEGVMRLMETRHKYELDSIKKRLDKLNLTNKKLTDEHNESEARLNEEILKVRIEIEHKNDMESEFVNTTKILIENLLSERAGSAWWSSDYNMDKDDDLITKINRFNQKIEDLAKLNPKIALENSVIQIKMNEISTGETQDKNGLLRTITFRKESSCFNSPSNTIIMPKATAIFKFEGKQSGELNFNSNDSITIISQGEDGW